MGVWSNSKTIITDAGTDLLAELAQESESLTLTRIVAGSDYTDPSGLKAKTSISNIQMDMTFTAFGRDLDGTAYVDAYLDNSEVETAFYHQQIGIYAEDTSGNDVLFLIAQADSPDLIPTGDTPVFITHRIFMRFSGSASVDVNVDFSGVVTQSVLSAALALKENAFNKNSAFNKNFSNTDSDYVTAGSSGYAGSSNSVARADHVHPIGTALKFAENNWSQSGYTNLLPDTDTWTMSSGLTPTTWGNYEFEATFQGAWEGFSCFFSAALVTALQGKTIEVGVDYLAGASARLELIVDGSVVNYLLATASADSFRVAIPAAASSVTLRIIIFDSTDLHCKFEGVHLYDPSEEVTRPDEGPVIYLALRKVRQANLPAVGTSGTLYITEQGNLYLADDNGALIALAGSTAL